MGQSPGEEEGGGVPLRLIRLIQVESMVTTCGPIGRESRRRRICRFE